jgi:hypothetical protein
MPMAFAGTIKNFYVNLGSAPGVGKTLTITFRKNGVDQAVTVSISDANTSASDTTHSFSFAAGDLVNWSMTLTAAGTNGLINATFEIDFNNA